VTFAECWASCKEIVQGGCALDVEIWHHERTGDAAVEWLLWIVALGESVVADSPEALIEAVKSAIARGPKKKMSPEEVLV
jgi:protoporphyrinogen oxidase